VRLGVSGVVALALLVFGFWGNMSMGSGLFSSRKAHDIMVGQNAEGGFAGSDMAKSWKPGDVILMRSGLCEADLLRSDIPPATRPQVERAILAPLTTLYPDSSRKPVIPLSFSEYRNEKVKTPAGDPELLRGYYDDEFVARLKQYNRFWLTGVGPDPYPNSWYYLAGVVPWMATALDRGDLVLARFREKEDRYITVKPNLGLEEPIKGLAPKPGEGVEDMRPDDFKNFAHIVRNKTAEDAKYDKKDEKKDDKKDDKK
jgi:hypothetical protein